MKRHIQDWQIRGGFNMNSWRLEVKEKNSWRVEAESDSTVELLKIANGLAEKTRQLIDNTYESKK